ncbi:MAG: hypothetical protein ACRDRJ_29210 [Streptosporangiaceae bacterium]
MPAGELGAGEPGAGGPGAGGPGAGGPGDGDGLSLDMLMAALRADSTDVSIYARVLTESLGEALPPGCVSVDRERSVSDRMRGRPGTVSKVTVRLGDRVMSLGLQRGAPAAEICREVRGVVLSRQPVPVGQWIAELARALMEQADQNAATAQALRRLVAGADSQGNP